MATGYRTIPTGYDVDRWRHRLFVYIRQAPRYTAETRRLDPEDGPAIEQMARNLHLTRNGKPCRWAVQHLTDDLHGQFDPDQPPAMWTYANKRVIELSVSPASVTVDTYRGWNRPRGRVRRSHRLPDEPMQVGADEWGNLERLAVEAARQAVCDLRDAYGKPTGSASHDRHRMKAGNEKDRDLQIERLALRLTGRAGTRNDPRTDRRWCDVLGIDLPPKVGRS